MYLLRNRRSASSAHFTRFTRTLQTNTAAKSPLAFCFDIDGVLLQGNHAIPCAKRALRMMEGENSRGLKIPYILLTNGGGRTEADRAKLLSSQLDVNLSERQLVQAHTILKTATEEYGDEPVLVLGGELDACRKIAESYGYKYAYLPIDYLAAEPRIWPFYKLTEAEQAVVKPNPRHPKLILTCHDPRNWALEIQLLCDMLSDPTEPPPKLVFCNPDLLWRTDFPKLRFGQGAFKTALSAVYKERTTKALESFQLGKPTKTTYEFAEGILMQQAGIQVGEEMPRVLTHTLGEANTHNTDNPESDIAGANAYGWDSILVGTGVYDSTEGPPTHFPSRILDNVEKAVEWAIDREFAPLGEKLKERRKWDGRVVKVHDLWS
ncbi:HAD-superfamily hydrolase [Calocera cornea HHB12733]|uniref:HAD-superfamily hydrolase n=1 Tax=Calocera cornea HHB12733 TaxID=1353952 RepID=A0A165FER6_9BASI|nr:HAD-superfamily hydrolase [Calocera cornea HHB12733]